MKILMVCMGNICRSPLAEVILKEKLKNQGLDVVVESAGTIRFHEGEGADQRSIETAHHHQLSLSNHTARGVVLSDFEEFDKIYVMDSTNYRDLKQMAGQKFNPTKVDFLLNEAYPGQNREVPDPYYGGKDGFEKVFQMLDKACTQVVSNLKSSAI